MKNENRFEIEGTFTMDTDAGPLCIINSNFVDPKVFSIFKHILDEFTDTGHGLTSIIFRMDGYPNINDEDFTTWVYQPDSMSAVCNLRHVVEAAVFLTLNEESPEAANISAKMMVWLNLIKGLLHEVHHAQTYLSDRPTIEASEEAKEQEELEAVAYANDKIKTLAKDIDIEPELGPYLEEMLIQEIDLKKSEMNEFIAGQSEEAPTNDSVALKLWENDELVCEGYERWIKLQEHMQSTGDVWYSDGIEETGDGEDMYIPTIKEYMCHLDGATMQDKEWLKQTIGVMQHTETSSTPPPPPAPAQNEPITGAGGWTTNSPNEQVFDDEEWGEDISNETYQQPTQVQAPTPAPTPPPAYVAPQQTTAPQQGGFQGNQYAAATPPPPPAPTPTTATPPPTYQAPTYAPDVQNMVNTGMTGNEMGTLMQGLYRKLFDHIFLGCQWDKTAFQEKNAITARLILTAEEDKIVTGMITQNESGSYLEIAAEGFISGKIMDRAKELPGYEIKFTNHLGQPGTRKLLPQNPNKLRSDGKPSYTAEMAQHGYQIMWIIDPDEGDKQFSKRMIRDPKVPTVIKMENNDNGKWE